MGFGPEVSFHINQATAKTQRGISSVAEHIPFTTERAHAQRVKAVAEATGAVRTLKVALGGTTHIENPPSYSPLDEQYLIGTSPAGQRNVWLGTVEHHVIPAHTRLGESDFSTGVPLEETQIAFSPEVTTAQSESQSAQAYNIVRIYSQDGKRRFVDQTFTVDGQIKHVFIDLEVPALQQRAEQTDTIAGSNLYHAQIRQLLETLTIAQKQSYLYYNRPTESTIRGQKPLPTDAVHRTTLAAARVAEEMTEGKVGGQTSNDNVKPDEVHLPPDSQATVEFGGRDLLAAELQGLTASAEARNAAAINNVWGQERANLIRTVQNFPGQAIRLVHTLIYGRVGYSPWNLAFTEPQPETPTELPTAWPEHLQAITPSLEAFQEMTSPYGQINQDQRIALNQIVASETRATDADFDSLSGNGIQVQRRVETIEGQDRLFFRILLDGQNRSLSGPLQNALQQGIIIRMTDANHLTMAIPNNQIRGGTHIVTYHDGAFTNRGLFYEDGFSAVNYPFKDTSYDNLEAPFFAKALADLMVLSTHNPSPELQDMIKMLFDPKGLPDSQPQAQPADFLTGSAFGSRLDRAVPVEPEAVPAEQNAATA